VAPVEVLSHTRLSSFIAFHFQFSIRRTIYGTVRSDRNVPRAFAREIATLTHASWLIMYASRPSQSPVYPINREQLPRSPQRHPPRPRRGAPCIASIQLILGLRHTSTRPQHVYVYACTYIAPARDL